MGMGISNTTQQYLMDIRLIMKRLISSSFAVEPISIQLSFYDDIEMVTGRSIWCLFRLDCTTFKRG